jgi:hypothetical protein
MTSSRIIAIAVSVGMIAPTLCFSVSTSWPWYLRVPVEGFVGGIWGAVVVVLWSAP